MTMTEPGHDGFSALVTPPPAAPRRRSRTPWIAALALVLVLAAGGAAFLVHRNSGPDPKKCEQLMRDAAAAGLAGGKAEVGNAKPCKGLTEAQFSDIAGRVIWSGLGGDASDLDTPATTDPAEPDEDGYLDAMHLTVAGTDFEDLADDDLVGLGQSVCSAIDRGASREEIMGARSGLDKATFSAVISDATAYLCPAHTGF